MAHWDLQSLSRELPALSPRLTLVVGDADRTIPPADVGRVCRLLPRARVINLPRLGHLAHEERADMVAEIIESVADSLTSACSGVIGAAAEDGLDGDRGRPRT